MTYTIRPAAPRDIDLIVPHLRAADIRELKGTYGHYRLAEGLRRSLEGSTECLVGCDADGVPQALFGFMKTSATSGVIWATATVHLKAYRRPFLVESRKWLDHLFADYGVVTLYNFSHADNTKHHRWLQWLGAKVYAPVPMGPEGEPFKPFIIRRTHHV